MGSPEDAGLSALTSLESQWLRTVTCHPGTLHLRGPEKAITPSDCFVVLPSSSVSLPHMWCTNAISDTHWNQVSCSHWTQLQYQTVWASVNHAGDHCPCAHFALHASCSCCCCPECGFIFFGSFFFFFFYVLLCHLGDPGKSRPPFRFLVSDQKTV